MSIDWDKPVQTRDGREVRIYTTEGKHPTAPLVGEIYGGGLCPPILTRWCADGSDNHSSRPNENDLINVPQKHTLWINIVKPPHGTVYVFSHNIRSEADAEEARHRIACIEVTFTEGEGLK